MTDLDKLEAALKCIDDTNWNDESHTWHEFLRKYNCQPHHVLEDFARAHLAAQRQGGDAEKIERDLTLYGVSFAQVGKRIDPKDVYIATPAVTGDRGALDAAPHTVVEVTQDQLDAIGRGLPECRASWQAEDRKAALKVIEAAQFQEGDLDVGVPSIYIAALLENERDAIRTALLSAQGGVPGDVVEKVAAVLRKYAADEAECHVRGMTHVPKCASEALPLLQPYLNNGRGGCDV